MVEILEILIIISEFLQMENTHKKTKLLLGDPSVSLWIGEILQMQNCRVENSYVLDFAYAKLLSEKYLYAI
jgi:hypothetical protein